MTAPEIRITPQAPAVYDRVATQLGQLQSTMPPLNGGGIDPGISAGADDHYTNTNQTFTGSQSTATTSSDTATGLTGQDNANSQKPKALDSNLGDEHSNHSGGGKPSARLTPSDLAKLLYQSPMPQTQTAPQMPSMPSMPQMPQIGQGMAPIQSMLGAPGAISPLLQQLLTGANTSQASGGLHDGGPKSMLMGATMPGDAGRVQQLASKLTGIPYAWGGGTASGPSRGISDGGGPADAAGDYNKTGFDCSGLAKFMTAQLYGVDLPHSSQQQYSMGHAVSASSAQPGDLVFPASAGRPPEHVQVYVGGGQIIEAPSSGQTVKISPLQAGSEFRTFRS